MMRSLSVLFIGMGYGVAWFAGILNTFVVVARLSAGQPPESFLPVALGAWGIIIYIHYRYRWFPFRR